MNVLCINFTNAEDIQLAPQFLNIHSVTFGTVVAHECVCGNITHSDHAQLAYQFFNRYIS